MKHYTAARSQLTQIMQEMKSARKKKFLCKLLRLKFNSNIADSKPKSHPTQNHISLLTL